MEPRFALVTFHGTVVHFDRVTQTLRHAPVGMCDANVFLTRDGAAAGLVVDDGSESRTLNDYRPDACGIAETGGTMSRYLTTLRGLELITGRGSMHASDELFSG